MDAQNKNTALSYVLISITVFCIILTASLYNYLKKSRLEFNEKKALFIKENLDLKDSSSSLQEAVAKKEIEIGVFKEEKESVENQLNLAKEEKKILEKEYIEQMEEFTKENVSLENKIKEIKERPIEEQLAESIAKEENENLKKVFEAALSNLELIKEGKEPQFGPAETVLKPDTKEFQLKPEEETEMKTLLSEITAEVVSVDRKTNLIVINLGRRNNIKEGDRCAILKDEKDIAHAEIIGVRYRTSAAFVSEMRYNYNLNDIEKGDRVLISEK